MPIPRFVFLRGPAPPGSPPLFSGCSTMAQTESRRLLSAPASDSTSPCAHPTSSAPADPLRRRQIPDFDLYLFNMGEHRRAHCFLGAHLVEGGVRFAVWAPNAQHVSV